MKKILVLILLTANIFGAKVDLPDLTVQQEPLMDAAKHSKSPKFDENPTIIAGISALAKDPSTTKYDFQDPDTGNTMMHFAAANGNYDIVYRLLIKPVYANANIQNKDGDMSLHLAVLNDSPQIANLIATHAPGFFGVPLKNINLQNNDGNTPLNLAAKTGNPETVNSLFENVVQKADTNKPNKLGNTSVHMAVLSDNNDVNIRKVLDILIAKGVKLDQANNDGDTALSLAAQNGKDNVVTYIIRKAKKPKALLKFANKEGNTALHFAAQNDHRDVINTLLTEIEDVKLKEELLKKQNKDGDTPLHVAARNGSDNAVARLLISLGVSKIPLDIQNGLKQTALDVAILNNKTKAAELILLAMGKKINTVDKDGNTPLHLAAQKGNEEIVRKLLANGADTAILNTAGLTAAQVAKAAGHDDLADLIENYKKHMHQMTIRHLQDIDATLRGLSKAAK